MPRPIKEGLDYFSHDTDIYMDDKMETLESVYGNDGYACYFKLLERIYRNGGKLFISDAETMQKYSKRCNINDVEKFQKIIELMVKVDLFDKKAWKSAKALISNGILKRLEVVVNKRLKMKERYERKVSSAETGISAAESTPSKVKESKVKKSITPENHVISSQEIQNFRNVLKWDDLRIKKNFLERGYPEQRIDEALGKKF
jgi:hypothetical protein